MVALLDDAELHQHGPPPPARGKGDHPSDRGGIQPREGRPEPASPPSRGRFTPETASAAGRRGAAERERRFLAPYRNRAERERQQIRQVRRATAILTMFLGPLSRPRRRLSRGQAELARILVPEALMVLARIIEEGEGTEPPQVEAAFTVVRFLTPAAPLLEPLPRSMGYRIRRLDWTPEEEQVREWLRAIDRGQSILG